MAYIFYDTETTGTSTAFDQILQFAAIKADDELNVVETFNLRCRLLPYVVPAPGALLVTGTTIADITTCPLSHFEMMRRVSGRHGGRRPASDNVHPTARRVVPRRPHPGCGAVPGPAAIRSAGDGGGLAVELCKAGAGGAGRRPGSSPMSPF
jgi:hypothetical protein